MRTQEELVERALGILGAASSADGTAPEDQVAVAARVGPLLARLQSRRVLFVASLDEIEDDVFEPLARLLAEEVAPGFGRASDATALDLWTAELIRLAPPLQSRRPARPDYF